MMLLLIPLFPFLGFLVNASIGKRLSKTVAGAVACAAMVASFAVAHCVTMSDSSREQSSLKYRPSSVQSGSRSMSCGGSGASFVMLY